MLDHRHDVFKLWKVASIYPNILFHASVQILKPKSAQVVLILTNKVNEVFSILSEIEVKQSITFIILWIRKTRQLHSGP